MEDFNIDKNTYKKYITNTISYTCNKKISLYNEKLNIIIKMIEELNEKIDNLQIDSNKSVNNLIDSNNSTNKLIDKDINPINNVSISSYKDIKKEYFNIDDSFIKECLNMLNIQGEIKIFKQIYIDNVEKEYYPIRHIKKKIQYWNDGHMIDDDSNANYVKNTVLKNIEECYLRVNTYDNYGNNMDQFLKNQDYIKKLSEQKYKDKFLLKIIEIISI